MERNNHLRPSLGMKSALTKGLALTNAGTPDAPCRSVELKPCLHYNKADESATQRLSMKKAVMFAPNVTMKVIPHKTSFPSNEFWYSREEQRQLMEESMEVVKLYRHIMPMSEDDFEETHNESIQGFEHYLSKRLYKAFKQEQDIVITTVPLFQEKMKAKGKPIDHEALSRVSQVLSAPARERAYQKGLQHARSSGPSQDTCGQRAARFQSQRHQRGKSRDGLQYLNTQRAAA